MQDSYYKLLYQKAYALLKDVTPLKADCGAVCGGICCKGDSETGMLLFLYEETTLKVIEKNGRRLAVCNGICDRTLRPLSCRLFPFFPVLKDAKVEACLDYRGFDVCPLILHCNEIIFNRRFLRRVKEVGSILYSDEKCAEFMYEIAEEIEEEKRLAFFLKK